MPQNSSTYNVTLVIYNPYDATSEVIQIPGLSNHGTFNFTDYHLNGVDYDYSTGLIYIAAGAATAFTSTDTGDYSHQNLTGPNHILRFDPRTKKFLADIDLAPASNAYLQKVGNRTSGFQDMTETPDGDVYAIGSFGSAIVKILRGSTEPVLWYSPPHYNNTYGFGGIFADEDRLVLSDRLSGGLVTFDTCRSDELQATFVPLQGLPDDYKPMMADGLFAPTKYRGKIALWSDDYNGTSVYGSKDHWISAHYLGRVSNAAEAVEAGGLAVATFDIRERIFSLNEYFQFELPVKRKKQFSMHDITADVDEIVRAWME